MDERVISLKHAIPVLGADGKEIMTQQLKIGRLKVKHLKSLPEKFFSGKKSDMNDPKVIFALLSGLSGLPEASVEEIDIDDLDSIIQGLVESFPKSLSPQTGVN